MSKYHIIKEPHIGKLSQRVNEYLENGWQIKGDVFEAKECTDGIHHHPVYCQVVINHGLNTSTSTPPSTASNDTANG